MSLDSVSQFQDTLFLRRSGPNAAPVFNLAGKFGGPKIDGATPHGLCVDTSFGVTSFGVVVRFTRIRARALVIFTFQLTIRVPHDFDCIFGIYVAF